MMKNGVYFIAIAPLVAELFKILIYISLYLPFYCYDFVLMSFYFNCYVRTYELM